MKRLLRKKESVINHKTKDDGVQALEVIFCVVVAMFTAYGIGAALVHTALYFQGGGCK